MPSGEPSEAKDPAAIALPATSSAVDPVPVIQLLRIDSSRVPTLVVQRKSVRPAETMLPLPTLDEPLG